VVEPLHQVGSEADFAALSDFEDDGEDAEEEEDEDESETDDSEDDDDDEEEKDELVTGVMLGSEGLPYPGFVPIALKYLDQSSRPRNWCLAMITNPYPLLL